MVGTLGEVTTTDQRADRSGLRIDRYQRGLQHIVGLDSGLALYLSRFDRRAARGIDGLEALHDGRLRRALLRHLDRGVDPQAALGHALRPELLHELSAHLLF